MKSQFSMCEKCKLDRGCCGFSPFIFEFEKAKFKDNLSGSTNLLKLKEKRCGFLGSDGCKIYGERPLDCVFFPFDIRMIKGKFHWIIWNFCGAPERREREIRKFEKKLAKVNESELKKYARSKFILFDSNNFKILREVHREHSMQA